MQRVEAYASHGNPQPRHRAAALGLCRYLRSFLPVVLKPSKVTYNFNDCAGHNVVYYVAGEGAHAAKALSEPTCVKTGRARGS